MQRRVIGLAVIFMMVFGLGSLSFAWDVTVRNATKCDANVSVHTQSLSGAVLIQNLSFFSGQEETKTAKTTIVICPSGLKGFLSCMEEKIIKRHNLASTNIQGDETENFTACCLDSSWTICRKHGKEGDPIKDNDYGFCRQ